MGVKSRHGEDASCSLRGEKGSAEVFGAREDGHDEDRNVLNPRMCPPRSPRFVFFTELFTVFLTLDIE